jgi:hypothetical protein
MKFYFFFIMMVEFSRCCCSRQISQAAVQALCSRRTRLLCFDQVSQVVGRILFSNKKYFWVKDCFKDFFLLMKSKIISNRTFFQTMISSGSEALLLLLESSCMPMAKPTTRPNLCHFRS